jgi:hypothetical protein
MDRQAIDVDLRFAPTAAHTAAYLNAHRDPKSPPVAAEDLIPSTARNRGKRARAFRRQRELEVIRGLEELQAARKK